MKHFRKIISGLFASLACLFLVINPAQLEAAKNSDKGTGSGNSQPPTGSSGTGNLLLGAPGVGLDFHTIGKTPFSHTTDIGRYYRYEFTGIEVQCDADGVVNTFSYGGHMWNKPQHENNGHGNNCDGVDTSNPGALGNKVDSNPDVDDECNVYGDHDGDGNPNHSDNDYTGGHFVYGWWTMGASVNNQSLGGLTFTSSKLHEQSPIKRKYFNSPVVFHEQNITLGWTADGNCNDPDGHLYILGSAMKEPPVPRGELMINQTHYADGATPQYGWNIERE